MILLDPGEIEVNETKMVPGLLALPVYLLLSERKVPLKMTVGGWLVL